MRILMTGSRGWRGHEFVLAIMQLATAKRFEPVTWVHGDCPEGLDLIVRGIVERSGFLLPKWTQEPHPADWSGPLGRRAGMQRNTHMVNLGADLCCAFIAPCNSPRCSIEAPHPSHGATDTAVKAEEAGIETWRFTRAKV